MWQGYYGDKDGARSIILEAIADQSFHIWHVFFGLLGSNNNINVLDRSPLVHNMLISEATNMAFMVNGCEYNCYYLLADGIYPQWSCFVQTIHEPSDEKRAHSPSIKKPAAKMSNSASGFASSVCHHPKPLQAVVKIYRRRHHVCMLYFIQYDLK